MPVAAAVYLGACYRYVPHGSGPEPAPPAGADVRIHLTPQGMTELEPRLGAQTATVIGRVNGQSERGVTLLVSETRKTYGGAAVRWVGEQVTLPTAAVARVERRAFDRRRSLLVGAAALLAAVAGFALIATANGDGSGSDGPGPIVSP